MQLGWRGGIQGNKGKGYESMSILVLMADCFLQDLPQPQLQMSSNDSNVKFPSKSRNQMFRASASSRKLPPPLP